VFAIAVFPGSSLAAPLAALVSLVPSWISFRWIENPFRLRYLTRPVATAGLGAACIALPLGAAVGSVIIERALPHQVNDFLSVLGPHNYQSRPCDEAQAASDPDTCTWKLPGNIRSDGHVALIGDSNAGHFSEAFLAAARTLNLDATIQTRASCPFIDLYLQQADGTPNTNCRSFYRSRMDWLLRTRPNLVVIAGVSDSLIQTDAKLGRSGAAPWIRSPSTKQGLWKRALRNTMARLAAEGIPTLVVNPVPRFPNWTDPNLCAPLRVIVAEAGCGTTISRSAALSYAQRAKKAEDLAVAEVPGSQILDPWPTLCPTRIRTCQTNVNDTWMFRNWNHLTADGSTKLTKPFITAMKQTMRP